jgi:NAD(P)-dependent dehydrogenase (short-subunit alcohol dehydrogenase family)
MQKVILITGTSTGIGLETALLLARSGHSVVATMRDTAKADPLRQAAEAENLPLRVAQLDVTDPASVETCVADVLAREGRIDTLVCNAGIGFLRSAEQATDAEIARIYETNVFGLMRCVRAVLPAMREAKRGHLVLISSVGGLIGQPMNEIYCSTKFAIEGYAESMATYLKPFFGIDISVVEPGAVTTEFGNSVFRYVEQTGGVKDDAYKPVVETYMAQRSRRLQSGQAGSVQTGADIAAVIQRVIEAEQPPVRVRTSAFAEEFCHWKTQPDPDGLQQTAAIRQITLGL